MVLWEKVCRTSIKSFQKRKVEVQNFWNKVKRVKSASVFIYGAGRNAKIIADILSKEGIQIRGFIISDDQPQQEGYKGIPIYFLSKVPKEYTDAFVIMSFISSDVETMLENKEYEYLALPYSLMEMINLK